MNSRESIYAALFAKLSGIPGIVTSSRKLKHWADVSAIQQPALFQSQSGESAVPTPRGLPTKWTFAIDIYLYAHAPDDAQPSTILNDLVDKIVAALMPNAVENVQTLGGLVSHCWIEGQIETDEGTLGNQAVAIIPIHILVS